VIVIKQYKVLLFQQLSRFVYEKVQRQKWKEE